MKIIAIKTKSCVYVSVGAERYLNSLENYLFDGEPPVKTYEQAWYEIKDIPKVVARIIPAKRVNERYELLPEYNPTEKLPFELTWFDLYDDDGEHLGKSALYELKFEMEPAKTEPVEFKITIVDELDDFKIVKQEFDFQSSLLDKIRTPKVLLTNKPCELTSLQSYNIIRKHIKENINPKHACITSDYDFCLTVEKKIELNEPEAYTIDENFTLFGRKKKPKYVTKYRKERKVEVYKSAPHRGRDGVYSGYPETIKFKGETYDDLTSNIESYLMKLMDEINKPLKDCPHCGGLGVVEGK